MIPAHVEIPSMGGCFTDLGHNALSVLAVEILVSELDPDAAQAVVSQALCGREGQSLRQERNQQKEVVDTESLQEGDNPNSSEEGSSEELPSWKLPRVP